MKNEYHLENLPRLVYFGDVPAESTTHGSAQIYRLLESYPVDRLLVMETPPPTCSRSERRLPAVPYHRFPITGNRWRFTRFNWAARFTNSWMLSSTSRYANHLCRLLDRFAPEAVLTVTHAYSWLVAAEFAESQNVPLHLVLHDDWPAKTMPVFPWLRSRQEYLFSRAYRLASSRLCISPFMEEYYRSRYGFAGRVLYPSRAKHLLPLKGIPRAYSDHRSPLVGAFAGNIGEGSAPLIAALAERLERRGGRLLLFGPQSRQTLQSWGLERKNILPQGLVSFQEFISRLRSEADFAFVPMSFQTVAVEQNARISFPSKIADYTSAGLPLLICGPEYCSAIRWAQRYPGLAAAVTSSAPGKLDAVLAQLEIAEYREAIGRSASEIGERLFSYSTARDTFYEALISATTLNNEHCPTAPSTC